jgi:hypothetical protein
MKEDVFFIILMIGVGCMLVGWIWSMIVARKISYGWFAGMAFLFIIILPIFTMNYWEKGKKPFLVSIVGFLLTLGSIVLFPHK